jgi:diaminopimelate epimerase
MMGGEFCGNALRCLGRWWAETHPDHAGPVRGEISGCEHPLTLWTEGDDVRAELPLPDSLSEWEGMPAAVFPGIVHALRRGPALPEKKTASLTRALCRRYAAPAAGILALREDGRTMTPAVYVRDTDTLFFESSCASGSAAAGMVLAARAGGPVSLSLDEPGGTLRVESDPAGETLLQGRTKRIAEYIQ